MTKEEYAEISRHLKLLRIKSPRSEYGKGYNDAIDDADDVVKKQSEEVSDEEINGGENR